MLRPARGRAFGPAESSAREGIAARIERLSALDGPSGLLQKAVARVLPLGSPAKDLLSGTWLGHPVHPPLTDVVIGSWTSAWLLDVLGGRRAGPAADALVGAGILAAVPTAAAGLSDWAELRGGSRRVGAVHALGNTTALALHAASWRARRRGRRASGLALSTLGLGVATFSAFLGGHLTFRRGVGVDETVFEELPDSWTAVTGEEQLHEGKPIRRTPHGAGIMLVRADGRIHALADRCSHRGCSLSEGTVENGAVTCPCHGSMFELAGGGVLRGPATAPQPALETRLREGKVEVRRRPE
jgi:nitrite reductase/ring-hydroxylating ferredoxin subunit/uncharacterized membrane protein